MTCRISSEVLRAIRADAAATPALEVCGLLLGDASAIVGRIRAANVAADPARHFEIDPATLIAALRAERGGGARIAGYYHSHPSGNVKPSRADADAAVPDGRLWLIVAGSEAALWRAVPDGAVHGRFDPVNLTVSSVAT